MGNGSTEKRNWSGESLDWKAATKRQRCLAYYQEELKLKVFQDKEADLYNKAVVKYGMSAGTDSEVAKRMLPAARRQAESAREILRRRGEMASVPAIASRMYFAWQVAYSDYLSWAEAQAAAVSAVADGIAPHAKQIDRLLLRSGKSRREAEGEGKKFLKQLKLSRDEVRKMLIEASMAVASQSWQLEEQPANELELLRKRVTQLEASETQRKQGDEESRKRHNYLEEAMEQRTAELEMASEQLQRELAERKRMEEVLRESKERYNQLVELASDGVAVQTEGKLVFANKAAAKLLGVEEPEQLVGQPIMDVVPPDYRQIVQEQVREVVERKRTAQIEYKLQCPNRVQANMEMLLTPVMYQDKPAVQMLVRDITDRAKMQKHLINELELLHQRLIQLAESEFADKQAQKQMRVKDRTIASSASAIAIADPKGNLTYVNHSFLRLWRYDDDKEVLGRPAVEFWRSEDKAFEILKTVRDQGSWVGKLGALGKDGSLFDVHVSASKAMGETGEPLGFIALFVDITEDERMQEQRIIADRLASLGQMASGIAHEINNPLTGVTGYAELLMKRKDIPKDIKKDLKIINDGGQRVASIVSKLVAFARGQKLEREETSINQAIASTIAIRAYEMETNNIDVTLELAPDLPITVAYRGQLQEAFLNIILNAETEMKLAHSKGNLLIRTEKVDNTIRISFTDDGPGIPKENLARIFDPFFTTREVGQGTGLGLTICHRIVAEHGGSMYAESEMGKGATFVVELPVVTEKKRLQPGKPVADEFSRPTGAKILVVDDEPAILEFLSQVLTDQGHQVETMDSASDALERVSRKRYRLILLDIEMSGINGIELYEHFREIAQSLAQRVVFITGDVLQADTRDFLSRTRAPCIAKPFDAEWLERDINRILVQGA